MRKVYVDTNVFLYGSLYGDRRGDACRRFLEGIVARRREACTSVLTWDEYTYVAGRVLGRERGIAQGEKLLRFPHLEFLACNGAVLTQAQALMAATPLKPRDALHAATALAANLSLMVSEDPDFDEVPGLQRLSAETAAAGVVR